MADEVDKWLGELKRGVTKFSILAILRDGDAYGYEIRQEFRSRTGETIELTEGNAYPALHSLENSGLVTSYWKDSESGLPARKYYHITDKGERLLDEMIAEWGKYTGAINNVWRRRDGDQ